MYARFCVCISTERSVTVYAFDNSSFGERQRDRKWVVCVCVCVRGGDSSLEGLSGSPRFSFKSL